MVVSQHSLIGISASPSDKSTGADNTRDLAVASPTSSDNSTNPSPFTVLSSSLSPAIYTPLSLSVDGSHFFYDEITTADADVNANARPDNQPSPPRHEIAPPNEQHVQPREDGGLSVVATRDVDHTGPEKSSVGAAATLQRPAVVALSSTFASASTSTSTSSSTPTTITETRQNMEKGEKQLVDDGAEITEFISRATGQPGSTPLPFLQPSRGRGRRPGDHTGPQRADPADNHNSSESRAATGVTGSARNTDAPSSPTSLIEQIQESLHQSSILPSASVPATADASSIPVYCPQPIVRTTSDSAKLTVCHPVPDLNTRSGAYVGNIAALEKTAERLSMTSSIEDAIRDLHCELKRSDSRRSSKLAAAVNANTNAKAKAKANAAASLPDDESSFPANTGNPTLVGHISSASNIVEVNSAARHGGYSPAGYVMSPNHSLTSRLRSGSKNSTGRPDFDVENFMSRQGPGKSSTRSVRSAKPSLAEIAESEPTALTREALDEADRLPWHEERQDDTGTETTQNGRTAHPVPTTDAFHTMLDGGSLDRLSEDSEDLGRESGYAQAQAQAQAHGVPYAEDPYRPPSRRSVTTFDANNAFSDFDGVHCAPDLDMPGMPGMPEPALSEPQIPLSSRHNMPRRQSYYDEETGQHMLYYPARVPAMLNLPPKLSRKPKTAVRNTRHSKVLQAMGHPGLDQSQYMPQDVRPTHGKESTVWLPDPVQSAEGFSSLFPPEPSEGQSAVARMASLGQAREAHQEQQQQQQHAAPLADGQHDPFAQPHQPGHHSPGLIGGDNRRSKLPRNLPPALRASAFFDLPSTSVETEAKDGSAMHVLDSILDASANAPVDAFLDHSFAGKLGKEVYGREKRDKMRSSTLPLAASSSEQKEQQKPPGSAKKRTSLFPFGKSDRDSSHSRKESITGWSVRSGRGKESSDDPERQTLSASQNGEPVGERGQKEGRQDASPEEEEEEFQGPPTTLLAELQIRKQEQKMRTRNRQLAAAGAMHSTLLEMDAVAEAQRRSRKSRRVNLAWEGPDGQAGEAESSDEDVPLGILYAARAAGNNDIAAVVAELNRPIGLLERRELEENEPLSARRARLQGKEALTLANRRSVMTLNPTTAMSAHRMSPSRLGGAAGGQSQSPQPEEVVEPEPEIEGETLGERMRRLKEKDEAEHHNLPRARPVSGTFSAELLSQFGDLDDEKAESVGVAKGNNKGDEAKAAAPPARAGGEEEEEETLGQRRKRLQAEREAREREMSMKALTGNAGRVSKRLSLANMLSAHPVRDAMPTTLTGQDEQRKRAEEQARLREQDARMAALRSQMPQALHLASTGTQAGGFRGGMYNDGSGGGLGGMSMNGVAQPAVHGGLSAGYPGGNMGMNMGMNMHANPNMGIRMVGPQGGMGGVPMNMGMNMNMNMQTMPMPMPMMPRQPGQAGQPRQVDSIERWRQSVMP